MTFKKSDPTVIKLYYSGGIDDAGQQCVAFPRVYHIPLDDKARLIEVLRENMREFR
jgi:hypothetical protein